MKDLVHRSRNSINARRRSPIAEMWIDGEYLSVSIATIETVPEAKGTRLVITEAGAYFGARRTRRAASRVPTG